MKKPTRLPIALILLILCVCLLAPAAGLAEAAEFEFDASAGRLTAYNGPGGDVVIPAEIDGVQVWDAEGGLFKKSEAVTSLTLPEGMDVMNNGMTSQLANLTRVSLPQSLRVICSGNFQLCPCLEEVTLPAGVSYIADNCFSWCDALRSITFTGVCPVISDFCFSVLPEDCVVHVPDDQYDAYRAAIPEEIAVEPSGQSAEIVAFTTPEDQFAFDPATGTVTGYRDRLARMDIPAEIGGVPVKAIGPDAFRPAYHLMFLTIPDGVEVIGDSAFAHTNSIQYIALPDSVREIGNEAFLGAIRGNRFHWPASLETIGSKAFNNCYFTDDIEFTANLKSIGDEAFTWSWPKSMILPEGCKPWIGAHAFDTAQLDYIQMDTYDFFEMAPDAFVGSRIEDIDLPWDSDAQNREAWQAYVDAQELSCTVWIDNPPEATYEDSGTYEKGADGYFYLTEYTGDQASPYCYYNIWDNSGEERVLVECRGLGDGVFKDNQTINSYYVTHANHPWHIGAEAFAGSSVERVDLFYTTETIGAGAFRDCKNLTELTLPASLTSIGAGAFDGCDNLRAVNILCDASILPPDAFANCAALQADPSGICLAPDASDEAVAQMSLAMHCPWYAPLRRVGEPPVELAAMPDTPTDPSAFEFDAESGAITRYLGNEVDVVVPREIDGVAVRAIRRTAFDSCRDYTDTDMATNRTEWLPLRSVVLPETVTTIEDGAFSYCQQLETFVCYGPAESTGRSTFQLCRGLKTVVFVNGTKMIDNYCFDATSSFETFYSAAPLDAIGERAFQNSGVRRFVVDAAHVANCAFMNCESLTELHLTGRVAQIDGSVAYNCPALSLVCLETDDLSAWPRDGFIAGCAAALTARVPEGAGEETIGRAQKCVMWGTECAVTVEQAACDRAPEAMPDIAAILADYAAHPYVAPTPEPTPEPIVAQPVGEIGEPYLGTWTASEIVMGGTTYSAAEMNMNASVTLNADGTADMTDVSGERTQVPWTVDESGALVDGALMTLTDDGRLFVDADGVQLYFAREGEAIAEPTPEPAPEPAPEPVPEGDGAFIDVKLNCVAVETQGHPVDPSMLGGEYAVTFHGDGTAEFMMSGNKLPNLRWTQDGDDRVIDYYGQGELRFSPTGTGYTLNFFDAMTMTFE